MHHHARLSGFTLLEFLLALTLSLFIYVGVMELYTHSTQHFSEAMQARESDSTALALLKLLQNAVSQAGCVSGPRYLMPITTAIALTENTLTVRYEAQPQVGVLSVSPDGLVLHLEPWYRHQKGQVLVLANENTLEMATVSEAYNTAHGEVVTLTQPLHLPVSHTTSVGRWEDDTFSLDESMHQLVVKNRSGQHLHLFRSVYHLHFEADDVGDGLRGVFISFDMGDPLHLSHWSGYAPLWSQLT